jgi:dihydropyrimidinase
VDIVSTGVAQAFGIYPRKGVIAPGSDADVIIFDPSVEHTISAASHHSRMDTNIYEGKRIRGKVRLLRQHVIALMSLGRRPIQAQFV